MLDIEYSIVERARGERTGPTIWKLECIARTEQTANSFTATRSLLALLDIIERGGIVFLFDVPVTNVN